MTKLISLCMIALNEEDFLPRALHNLGGFWDELIVVVDSRTTDRTAEIVEAAGGTVIHYEYTAPGNLAEMRNVSLDAATGEWIVVLDADEIIQDPELLRACLASVSNKDARDIMTHLLIYDENGNLERSRILHRIWRRGTSRYKYRMHETPMIVKWGPEDFIRYTFMAFEHRQPTYRDETKKAERLAPLLLDVEENPGDIRPLLYLIEHYLQMERWQEALDWGIRANGMLQLSQGNTNDYAFICAYMFRAAEHLGVYLASGQV